MGLQKSLFLSANEQQKYNTDTNSHPFIPSLKMIKALAANWFRCKSLHVFSSKPNILPPMIVGLVEKLDLRFYITVIPNKKTYFRSDPSISHMFKLDTHNLSH